MNKGALGGFGRDGKAADGRMLTFDLDGAGSAIGTGAKVKYKTVPIDCTIVGWRLMGGPAGSIVLDVWAARPASFPPVVANTLITSGAKPTLATATFAEATDLKGWNCDLDAGDVLEINVDSCTTTTRAILELNVIPR